MQWKFLLPLRLLDPLNEVSLQLFFPRREELIIAEDLLFKAVDESRVVALLLFHLGLLNDYNCFEIWVNWDTQVISSNWDSAELSPSQGLVVLVEHIIETLVDSIESNHYAGLSILHAVNDLVNRIIERPLIEVTFKVDSE